MSGANALSASRVGAFAAAFVTAEMGLITAARSGALEGLQLLIARASAALLTLLGSQVAIAGHSVVTYGGTVTVGGLCLPISPLALGIALLAFQTPGRASRRTAWACLLVAALVAAGIARITLVAALVQAQSPLVPFVHETLTPIAWMAVPLAVWFLALKGRTDG